MSADPTTAERDDDWMVQAAAQAAPALPAQTIDTLRRYLTPTRAVVTPICASQPKKAA